MAQQNIKDRYYGVNDPVAKKLLGRVETFKTLTPPEDKDITTLYIGGLTPNITEADLRDNFYSFGEVKSIKIVPKVSCAFISYTTREAAEAAAEALFGKLNIKGVPIRILWGKPHQYEPGQFQLGGGDQSHLVNYNAAYSDITDATGKQPQQPQQTQPPTTQANFYPPPAGGPSSSLPSPPPGIRYGPPSSYRGGPIRPYYPSQDPSMMGSYPVPVEKQPDPAAGK